MSFAWSFWNTSKTHPELENSPGGISAVAAATPDAPPGVVFVLKNVHNEVNADQRNRLHPYYLVYLSEESVTVHDHLSPKDTLDAMRQLCRGRTSRLKRSIRRSTGKQATGGIWPCIPVCWRMRCCPFWTRRRTATSTACSPPAVRARF